MRLAYLNNYIASRQSRNMDAIGCIDIEQKYNTIKALDDVGVKEIIEKETLKKKSQDELSHIVTVIFFLALLIFPIFIAYIYVFRN
ncbi:hypothetical protein ACEYX6_09805 [Acinetobacter sp. c2-A9]